MEVKKVNRDNGKTYCNIDLRDIPYGNSESIVLLNNDPYEMEGQYGKSYIFKFLYNNEEVTAFVPENYKAEGFGRNLATDLQNFERGDIISIYKLEGKTKSGRPYRFFKAVKTGTQNVPDEVVEVTTNQSEVKLNLSLPNGGTSAKAMELNATEQQIFDAIKDRKDLSTEQRQQLFIQNGVVYNRAREIVDKLF